MPRPYPARADNARLVTIDGRRLVPERGMVREKAFSENHPLWLPILLTIPYAVLR